MKYNFKKNSKLAFICLVVMLLSSLVLKNISKSKNVSYYEDKINSTITLSTINESKSEDAKNSVESTSGEEVEKIAYITIDDGPSKYTSQILDILDKHDVKATFFMINRNMNIYQDDVKRIQQDGHGAGFHSVTHDIKELYKTPEATLNEFFTCKETFKEITGASSNLVRIPYGSKPKTPEESYNILVENDFLVWDWNLDTRDWQGTTDNILSNVLLNGRNKDELVLLVHEKQQTVDALEGIITVLKERGYKILPITEDKEAMNFWRKNL